MEFTHLHVHTEYSLLDGSNKINEYVARVKELGMDSAAITDHGVMFGCIDFYRAAKAAGIKAHSGMRGLCCSRFQIRQGDRRRRKPLLSSGSFGGKQGEGYQNLMKIVSKAFMDGFITSRVWIWRF